MYLCMYLCMYPHADRNTAENLIVRREVAVDSVHRLIIHWTEVPKRMLREFCLFIGNVCSKSRYRFMHDSEGPIRPCQLYRLSASNRRVGRPAHEISKPIKGSFLGERIRFTWSQIISFQNHSLA